MESNFSDSITVSQSIPSKSNRPPTSVRQPVSCEPCRKRKIKCSRTKPPCDTCRRRGCIESCIYKKVRNEPQPSSPSATNEELLNRINNLEVLLRRCTGAQVSDLGNGQISPLLSPPTEFNLPLGTSTLLDSYTSESPSQISTGQRLIYTPGRRLGSLMRSPTGNVRYNAESSQWNSVLANTGLSDTMPALKEFEDTWMTSGFPFTSAPPSSMDELLALLPPTQQCDYLKDIYFTVFSPLLHILHDPTFHGQYTRFTADPNSTQVSWLAILFILLSLAVTALEEGDPILRDLARGQNSHDNIRVLSRRYRDAAMKCLVMQGVFWGKHNMQSLQALVLLIYAMGHSQDPTWALLGMTYNVAIALGCHIDPETFDLDPIQCEERRRCWAGLLMQYTIQNTLLGSPDPSLNLNYDVRLPADVNDNDITLSGIRQTVSGPSQMSYLLYKFQLYGLCAKICRQMFASTEPSRLDVEELDRQICEAQETWDARYHSDSTFDTLPTYHAVHLHILHAYSHQLFLLLHRPFFAQSIRGLDVPNESQIKCIASAEALLDIHRILSETAEFRPYRWYTNGLGSFHAFHAAVVLAVGLLMPIYKLQHQKFKTILDQTLNRFEKAASLSKISDKSAKVLKFLLSTPSPNQPFSIASRSNTSEHENDPPRTDWPLSDYVSFFVDKLQPQQWLSPANIPWTQWDDFMAQTQPIAA